MKPLILIPAVIVSIFTGCAAPTATPTTEPAQSAQAVSSEACITNFKTEGGFWSGQRHSTFDVFRKTTPSAAFNSLLQAVSSSGYQIVTSNKDAGSISANQTVSYGQGKTTPLNLVIKDWLSGFECVSGL